MRRLMAVVMLIAALATAAIAQPWSFLQEKASTPIAPSDEEDEPMRGSGYILSEGGGDRHWALSVDLRGNDLLCFLFVVKPASPESWCDRSIKDGASWAAFHTFRPEPPQKIVFGAVSSEVQTLTFDIDGPDVDERIASWEPSPEGFPRDDLRFFAVIYEPTRGITLAITDGDDNTLDELTIPATPTIGKFQVSYGRGSNLVNGILEIDATRGSVCSSAQLPWARAAQLHQESGARFADEVVITIFEPPTAFRETRCAKNQDPVTLMRVLDDPDSYYIDYHERENGGRRAKGQLGDPTQSNVYP